MSAVAAPGPSLRRSLTGWRARLRTTHPVTVLRWLRGGVLAMVLGTALLYLLVSIQADHQIAAARRTAVAIADIESARLSADHARNELVDFAAIRQVGLTGPGAEFAIHTGRVSTDLTSAAQGNAAGRQGLTQILFVQGQLTSCTQSVYATAGAAPDSTAGLAACQDALHRPREVFDGRSVPGTGGIQASLEDLSNLERTALDHQRHSRWLDPALVRGVLLGPVLVMALLVTATGSVTRRHFRRYASRKLTAALSATAAVAVVTCLLSRYDERHLAAHPWAGHPVTLALALTLLTAAGALAYLAYLPRLAEYRFPRS
ncbi:hypothetical protein [Streptomyces sp. NBC_01190]|uniref:hypothetical protein n=1 Tax=Streptomyces sp. NBC_01190 TaxID=2903767 RepID=UPI003870BB9F|nr:hypothetical protein OG519_19890 [Streptomyces sp. NBC_01190]